MFDEKPGLYLAVADPGEGPAPIFLDQNEARRAEKIFWVPGLPPISHLSQSLGDRGGGGGGGGGPGLPHIAHLSPCLGDGPPPPPPPPSSEGLDPPLSSIPLAEVGKDKQ